MADKNVGYGIEADFSDLTKGIRDLLKGLQDVNTAFNQLGKKVDDALGTVANETKKAGAQVSKMGAELRNAARDAALMTGAMTTGLVAAIKTSADTFAKFERTMNTFNAVSGATASQLERFKGVALDLGAQTKFTAQEIAEAGVELAKMGFTADESAAAIGGMVDAAVASGESLQGTSEIIAATMRQFGLAAKDSAMVGDIITKAANDSSISIQDWGVSMRYLGSAAAAADQPLTDMAALLVDLGNAGVKASIAGNGLQNAILRLQAPTEAAAGWMEKFNLQVQDKKTGNLRNMIDIIIEMKKAMEGIAKTDQAKIMKDMFGEVALSSMQVFFNKTEEELRATQAEMKNFQGTAGETADKMRKGLGYAMDQMKASIEALKISMGEEFAPTILAIAKAIQSLASGFNDLPKPVKSAAAQITLLATAVLGAFTGAAGIGMVVSKGLETFKALGSGISKIASPSMLKFGGNVKSVAMVVKSAAGSIAVVLGQVAAVAYVVYKAYKTNFGGMKDIIDGFVEFLVGPSYEAISQFGEDFNTLFADLKQKFAGVWLGITDTLITFLGFADQMTQDFFTMIGNISRAMRALIEKDWNWFKAEADNALARAKDIFNGVKAALNGDSKQVERWRELAKQKFAVNNADKKGIENAKKRRKEENELNKSFQDVNKSQKTQLDIALNLLDAEMSRLKIQEDQLEQRKNNLEIEKLNTQELEKQADFVTKKTTSGRSIQVPAWVDSLLENADEQAMDEDAFYTSLRDGGRRQHKGFDFHGKVGAKVKAPSAGTVLSAFTEGQAGSNAMIVVKHDDGSIVRYIHASALVKAGVRLNKGDVMGELVNLQKYKLGRSHVHVDANNKSTNPQTYTGLNQPGSATSPEQTQLLKDEKSLLEQRVAAIQKAIVAAENYKKSTSDPEQKQKAEEAIRTLNEQLESQKTAISKFNLDVAKMRADAEKEFKENQRKLIDEQLKILQDGIGNLRDASLSIMAEMDTAVSQSMRDLADNDFSSALSEDELIDFIVRSQSAVSSLKSEIGEYDAAIADLMANENKSAEQQQQLGELQNQRRDAVMALAVAQRNLNTEVENQGQILGGAEYTEAQEKFEKLMKALRDSPEDASRFFEAVQNGTLDLGVLKDAMDLTDEELQAFLKAAGENADLEDLRRQFHLTEAQLTELLAAIGEAQGSIDFKDAQEKFKALLETMRNSPEAAAQFAQGIRSGAVDLDKLAKKLNLTRAQLKELLNVVSDGEIENSVKKINTALSAVVETLGGASSLMSKFGTDVTDAISKAIDGMGQFVSGIGNMVTGAASMRPDQIIGGMFQSISSALSYAITLIQTAKQELHELNNSSAQGTIAQNERILIRKRERLRTAKINGAPDSQLKSMTEDLYKSEATQETAKVVAAFKDQFGASFELNYDENGLPDFMEIIDRYNEGIKTALAEGRPKGAASLQKFLDMNKGSIIGYANEILGITNTLNEKVSGITDEFENSAKKSQSAVDKYWNDDAAKQQADSIAQGILNQFAAGDDALREAVAGTAEKLAQERIALANQFRDENGDWLEGGQEAFEHALIGWGERVGEEMGDAIEKAVDKAGEAAEKQLREQANQLKKVMGDQFEYEKHQHDLIIEKEQAKVDAIQDQIDKHKELQDWLEERRREELGLFEDQDKSMFQSAMAAIDYDAAVRQGLEDVHNPEGVLTGTYSSDTIAEAIRERIAIASLQNQNRFNYEEYSSDPEANRKEFIKNQKEIMALQGRAAEEALKQEGLSSRQIAELEQMRNEAYLEFQELQIEAINRKFDVQIEGANKEIAKDNERLRIVQLNIQKEKDAIDQLRVAYEDKAAYVDEQVDKIIGSNNRLAEGIALAATDIKGAVNGIVNTYKDMIATANAAASAIARLRTMQNRPTSYGVDDTGAPAVGPVYGYGYAEGGVVPPGYPNDTYPALLSSGEAVFPEWFTKMLKNTYTSMGNLGGGSVVNNTGGDVHININGGNLSEVERVVMNVLRRNGGGARVNGAYYMNTGLN